MPEIYIYCFHSQIPCLDAEKSVNLFLFILQMAVNLKSHELYVALYCIKIMHHSYLTL